MKNKFCILIPARLKSKRLPNKPLLSFKKKTLIEHTIDGIGKKFDTSDIYVFTDSNSATKKISNLISKKSINVISINKKCINGTERCSFGLKHIKKKYDGYLILSCDFIGVKWNLIKKIFSIFNDIKNKVNYVGSTAHVQIKKNNINFDKSVVKVILNNKNDIIYLSRNQIPSNYKSLVKVFSHHGPVCLKRNYLNNYKNLRNTNLQLSEDNEWLKFIENGYQIRSVLVPKINQEINNKMDLKRANKKNV